MRPRIHALARPCRGRATTTRCASLATTLLLLHLAAALPARAAVADDFAATVEHTSLDLPVADLLANDTTSEGGSVGALWLIATPERGTLGVTGSMLTADDLAVYLPEPGFIGFDRFLYADADDSGGVQATVWLRAVAERTPIAGNWQGDARYELGYYQAAGRNFYRCGGFEPAGITSLICQRYQYPPAKKGWTPLVGDWNGDGFDDLGLYDPHTGEGHLLLPARYGQCGPSCVELEAYSGFQLADPRLMPVVGDWDGDGFDTLGVYDPIAFRFTLYDDWTQTTTVATLDTTPADPTRRNEQPFTYPCADGSDTVALREPDSGELHLGPLLTPMAVAANGEPYPVIAGPWLDPEEVVLASYEPPPNHAVHLSLKILSCGLPLLRADTSHGVTSAEFPDDE